MFNQFYHQVLINSIFPARRSDATEQSHFPKIRAWELCANVHWVWFFGFFWWVFGFVYIRGFFGGVGGGQDRVGLLVFLFVFSGLFGLVRMGFFSASAAVNNFRVFTSSLLKVLSFPSFMWSVRIPVLLCPS